MANYPVVAQRKKRVRRAKRNAKPAPTTKQLNRRLKHMEHMPELQYKDTYQPGVVPTASVPLIMPLNILSQGDSVSQRKGNKITATGLKLDFWIRNENVLAAVTEDTSWLRCTLLYDMAPAGAVPVVLTSSGPNAIFDNSTIIDQTIMPRNIPLGKRYKILWDKVLTVTPTIYDTSNTVSNRHMIHKKKFFKLKRVSDYIGNTGAINDLQSNSLIFLVTTSFTADGPTITCGARFFYKDY